MSKMFDCTLLGDGGRLQGELAVSRSVGDLQYRPFGLTAEPEFSKWHEAGPGDEWLILASDGVFESLTEDQICDIAAATLAGQPPIFLRLHIFPPFY